MLGMLHNRTVSLVHQGLRLDVYYRVFVHRKRFVTPIVTALPGIKTDLLEVRLDPCDECVRFEFSSRFLKLMLIKKQELSSS